MTKKEGCLLAAVFLLFGMVLGFLLAPVKAGVQFGNRYGLSECGRKKRGTGISENGEKKVADFRH